MGKVRTTQSDGSERERESEEVGNRKSEKRIREKLRALLKFADSIRFSVWFLGFDRSVEDQKMVGSEATDRRCLRHHLIDDDDELESHRSSGSGVSCSICLDLVSDDGKRSRAKLHCGHEFHLDCIGSAFNMKGAMQCPNCRKVEKGQWLYANGSSCSLPEFNMEDLIPDEDPYDLSYAEMPFRVHWCPFGGLPRLRSSFEEMDYPSTTYNGFPGHHALFSEHATASSVAHSYIAYYRPVPLPSSNSADNIDDPNLNHHWNGPPGHGEIFDPHTFSAIHNHHHSWGHHAPGFPTSSSHINGADPTPVAPATQRSAHSESDVLTRSRPFPHPFVFGHGSGPGAGSSYVSSTASHHPSGNARVSHAFHHPTQQTANSHNMPSSMVPGIRRLDGQIVPPPPQLLVDNFYVFPPSSGQNSHEAENAAREREHSSGSGWHSSSFHQAADPGNRTGGGMWHGQWPWRS